MPELTREQLAELRQMLTDCDNDGDCGLLAYSDQDVHNEIRDLLDTIDARQEKLAGAERWAAHLVDCLNVAGILAVDAEGQWTTEDAATRRCTHHDRQARSLCMMDADEDAEGYCVYRCTGCGEVLHRA